MAAFACGKICAKKRPLGERRPAEVLALRYELGRLHSLGLLQTLILSLRIADSFGEHLAKLSLGLCGFALGWLPLGHREYVGMREAELNPCWTAKRLADGGHRHAVLNMRNGYAHHSFAFPLP